MSTVRGFSRRALMLLGGCAVAVGVAFLTCQSASAAPNVNNCQSAPVPKVNWSGCSLAVSLSDVDLSGGKFIGTKWGESSIQYSNLSDADFSDSQFAKEGSWNDVLRGYSGTRFQRNDLRRANFAKTSGKINIAGSKLNGANVQDADMRDWSLIRAYWGGFCLPDELDSDGRVYDLGIVKGTPKVLPQNDSPWLPWFLVNGEFVYNKGKFPECKQKSGAGW